MKNLLTSLILSCCLCLLAFTVNAQQITCTIKGKTVGRDSKSLKLLRATDDARGNHVIIPITNNAFEHKLTLPVAEAYYLVFEDELQEAVWFPILFFPENGEIHFTLHPMRENKNNVITGSKQIQMYQAFHLAIREEFIPKVSPLQASLDELNKKGEGEGAEAKAIQDELEDIDKKAEVWKNKYIDTNPSLVTYFLFIEDLLRKEYTNEDIRRRYTLLADKFPNHPYTQLAAIKLESLESIKVGGKFIDFSAPDLDGKVIKLSDILKAEITLIDLWASWCGPCIRTSRNMMPLYETYKDKGFNVVGVAREFKNADAMKRTIEKEKFPWTNLLELDDKNDIWHKYNLSYAGGGTVLVDKEGTILALDPSADEVQEILKEKLKK